LLAAPVPRAYLVIGNMIVAIGLATVQVAVLIGLSAIRGGAFHITGTGVAWFVVSALLFTIFMYGLAETLAARVTKQEDYVGAVPAVAILPFFLAGALYPIGAMPAVLTAIAKAFPLTHALALMRYGFIDPSGKGLHDIWGMHSVTAGAHALRVHRSQRQGTARHLGDAQRHRGGVAEPGRVGGVGRGADADLHPGLRPLGHELTLSRPAPWPRQPGQGATAGDRYAST
jgi:ABC-type polysaccharide/polyol phosphate export permease